MIQDQCGLGVDFGTSTTVAVLAGPDGRPRPLLFDGTELLPSAVCADEHGSLLVGRDAVHAARAYPGGYEPHPKRSVDDGTLLLGGREFPVPDVFAAVLRRVAVEAGRVTGGPVPGAVLTCPAGWGARRQAVLAAAAEAAGLPNPRLLAEPVAAGCAFTGLAGAAPAGARILVYDLGAGTFDASVVRSTGDGFDVLAEHGLPDAGGLDIDAAIVAHLGATYAQRDAEAWQRLTRPSTPADRRAAHAFREDVRIGKEILSRTASTLLHVPIFDDDALLTRVQLEQLALPILQRTMRATHTALREAGVGPGELAGLFLVGGASRMPLAATLLHRHLGVTPTVVERPELVVAEGSLLAGQHTTVTASVAAQPVADAAAPPPSGALTPAEAPVAVAVEAVPPAPARSWLRRRGVLAGAAAALVVAVVAATVWYDRSEDRSAPASTGSASTGGSVTVAGAAAGGISGAADGGVGSGAAPAFIRTLTGHDGEVTGLAFLPTGTGLVSSSNDSTSRVWTVASGASGAPFSSGHGGYCVAVSPDGAIATGGNADRTARLWSGDGGRNTATLTGHTAWVRAIAFSPDGNTLATGSFDTTARLWDAHTGKAKNVLQGHSQVVYDLAFSPDGSTLVTAGGDGTLRLWDVATGRGLRTITTGWSGVYSVAYSPDGATLAAVGAGGQAVGIRFWNPATATPARAAISLEVTSEAVRYSPDGRSLAVAEGDDVRIHDTVTGALTATLRGHTATVRSLAYRTDGAILATGSEDHTIRLWQTSAAAAWPVAPAPSQASAGP
ncbi:Hsp70 family protein [Dactylosporangium sp. NPDC049525]|uniref:Hsp70 family protein n=1 Tax=Dactylosporangium sp. NPDC049525 TaxID=3154730 RepID=UPI003425D85C